MMKTRLALCAFLPLALVATACGDDDDSSSDTAAPAAEEPAAEPEAEEPAPEPAAEEPAAEPAPEPAPEAPPAPDPATETGLWANVPEVPNATEAAIRAIQEGGIQAYGTIEDSRDNIVPTYSDLLVKNGWTIESSGGDPGGDFGGGVQATYPDGRYLSLGFGGPPESTTFGQLCVWPAKPGDTNCPQGDEDVGGGGDDDDGDDDDGGNTGPPEFVKGYIPDFAEQFIP